MSASNLGGSNRSSFGRGDGSQGSWYLAKMARNWEGPDLRSTKETSIMDGRASAAAAAAEIVSDEAMRGLLERCMGGDRAAFERLYRRYRPDLYQLCLSRLRDPAAAEDVVQETFVRALANMSRFDLGRQPWPWLRTIGERLCTTFQRRHGRAVLSKRGDVDQGPADEGRVPTDVTLDTVIRLEEQGQLVKALASLPSRQRSALLLHLLEGWTYSEIADAENLSIPALKSIIFRARTSFRRAYESGTQGLTTAGVGIRLMPRRLFRRALRAFNRAHSEAEPLIQATPAALSLFQTLALGLATVLTGGSITPVLASSSTLSTEAATIRPEHALVGRAASQRPRFNGPGPSYGPQSVDELVNGVLRPGEGATPENSTISSFAISPDFKHDQTLFAAARTGKNDNIAAVLLVSRDSGQTWRALRNPPSLTTALEFFEVIFAPDYPSDNRIYVLAADSPEILVLFRSRDDGRSFTKVATFPRAPGSPAAAISPNFEKDGLILVASGQIFKYQDGGGADSGAVSLFAGQDGLTVTVVFSPSYETDGIVFYVARDETSGLAQNYAIYQCSLSAGPPSGGELCSKNTDIDNAMTLVSLSSGDRESLWAYSTTELYKYSPEDGGEFSRTWQVGMRDSYVIQDLAAGDYPGHSSTMAMAPAGWRSTMLISSDGGRDWKEVKVPLLTNVVFHVLITPTGQLLAAGQNSLACSVDGGVTWDRRCRSEVGAYPVALS